MTITMRLALLTLLVAAASLVAVPPARAAQVPIAGWTFETSQPTSAGPFAAEMGTGLASVMHTGAATYSSPSGNGSAHSFSSNTWSVGDYYQFTFASTGLTGLSLSFDQTSSNTGPASFKVQGTTNGTSYTDIAGDSYTVLANASPNLFWNPTTSYSAYTYSFGSLPSGLVGIRLVDNSTVSAAGGTVATGGTDRVDNVFLSGNSAAAAVPEPSSIVLALTGVVGFGLAACRRRRRSSIG